MLASYYGNDGLTSDLRWFLLVLAGFAVLCLIGAAWGWLRERRRRPWWKSGQ